MYSCECMPSVCRYQQGLENGIKYPGSELQVIVSYPLSPGKWTPVLKKSNKCSWPTSRPIPAPQNSVLQTHLSLITLLKWEPTFPFLKPWKWRLSAYNYRGSKDFAKYQGLNRFAFLIQSSLTQQCFWKNRLLEPNKFFNSEPESTLSPLNCIGQNTLSQQWGQKWRQTPSGHMVNYFSLF